jgi:hypothetical protein
MAMNGDVGTRFHGIQKTVALLIQTLMKVQIHPQPRRCLGLSTQVVKCLIVYNHNGLPLILCHTIGKNKNFSFSVTILPKIFVLLERNIHHTSSVCHPPSPFG